jgi:uncharacterized membrane protein
MKFVEPMRKLHRFYKKSNKSKTIREKVLVYIIYVCTILIYVADNIVWLANIDLIDKSVTLRTSWINYKDSFCFLKNALGILRSVLAYQKRALTLENLWSQLSDLPHCIEENGHSYDCCSDLHG